MPVSGRSAVVGYGRQVAEGTALTVPKYEHAMGGGSVGPIRETGELPWTTDTQDVPGHFVNLNAGSIKGLQLPVLPLSAAVLLQAVMGTRTTTGAEAPYSHAMTFAETLPWLTFFYAQPGANFLKLADAKVGDFALAWEPGQPLTLTVNGAGKTMTRAAAKWAAATVAEGVDPFFTYIGATMNFEVDDSPAATRIRWIRGGSISVNRNLDAIQTDGMGYQYLSEQARSCEIALNNAVFEDSTLINALFFGGGTEQIATPVYGSFEFEFLASDGTVGTDLSLTLASPRVLWTVSEVPAADPSGATVAYTVTGATSKPAAGSALTATLINDDAGTNY